MNFLKSVISFFNGLFAIKSKDKGMESEIIEAFKKFFVDKDMDVLINRITELLGSPISWANMLTIGRLNYIIFTASKGKLLTVEDFVDVYGKIIPTNIRIALGLFK